MDLSGVRCFGLSVDETTDVGLDKQVSVYLKTASTKRKKFLGLVTITGSTADDIAQVIQGVLLHFGLDIQNMVSFSSEGCSTTRGGENGVLIKLNRLINIAPPTATERHRRQVPLHASLRSAPPEPVSHDIFLSERTPATVCQVLIGLLIVKYCHSWFASSERQLEYTKLIKEHTVVEIIASWNETRWLSRCKALKDTCYSTSASLQFIEENAKGKQSPEGLVVAKCMSDPDVMTELNAAVRSIFDIYAMADVVLVADKELNKVGRRLVDIIGCFSADGVVTERGFSQLARIRAKLCNHLRTRNLNASMCLRLNPIPPLESVLTRWKSEKERRRKVVYPQKERKQYTIESDLDCCGPVRQ